MNSSQLKVSVTSFFILLYPGHLGRVLYEEKRREAAAIMVQKTVRMWRLRRSFQSMRRAAILVQACVRAFFLRQERRRKLRTDAAIRIQVRQCHNSNFLV